jgi:hypothetical protein
MMKLNDQTTVDPAEVAAIELHIDAWNKATHLAITLKSGAVVIVNEPYTYNEKTNVYSIKRRLEEEMAKCTVSKSQLTTS